jgi:hypothetical protein
MAVVVLVCFWAPVCAVLVEFLLRFRFWCSGLCVFFLSLVLLSLGDAVIFFFLWDVVCGMGEVRCSGRFFASRLRDGRMSLRFCLS